jgi:hypothetical protein
LRPVRNDFVTRAEFILEAAHRAAEEALLDRALMVEAVPPATLAAHFIRQASRRSGS